MSQYHNNNLIHNIRMGVEMVHAGMSPALASFAMAEVGIDAPAPLLEAAARPRVLDSMGAKPFTHDRKDDNIAAYRILQAHLAEMQLPPESIYEGECVYEEGEDTDE